MIVHAVVAVDVAHEGLAAVVGGELAEEEQLAVDAALAAVFLPLFGVEQFLFGGFGFVVCERETRDAVAAAGDLIGLGDDLLGGEFGRQGGSYVHARQRGHHQQREGASYLRCLLVSFFLWSMLNIYDFYGRRTCRPF